MENHPATCARQTKAFCGRWAAKEEICAQPCRKNFQVDPRNKLICSITNSEVLSSGFDQVGPFLELLLPTPEGLSMKVRLADERIQAQGHIEYRVNVNNFAGFHWDVFLARQKLIINHCATIYTSNVSLGRVIATNLEDEQILMRLSLEALAHSSKMDILLSGLQLTSDGFCDSALDDSTSSTLIDKHLRVVVSKLDVEYSVSSLRASYHSDFPFLISSIIRTIQKLIFQGQSRHFYVIIYVLCLLRMIHRNIYEWTDKLDKSRQFRVVLGHLCNLYILRAKGFHPFVVEDLQFPHFADEGVESLSKVRLNALHALWIDLGKTKEHEKHKIYLLG